MMAVAGKLHHSIWKLNSNFSKGIWDYLGFIFLTLSCITLRFCAWRWFYLRLLTFGVGIYWVLAGNSSPVDSLLSGQLWYALGFVLLLWVLTPILDGLLWFWTFWLGNKRENHCFNPSGPVLELCCWDFFWRATCNKIGRSCTLLNVCVQLWARAVAVFWVGPLLGSICCFFLLLYGQCFSTLVFQAGAGAKDCY